MPTVTLKLFSLQHNGAFPEAFARKLRPTVLPLTLAGLCGFSSAQLRNIHPTSVTLQLSQQESSEQNPIHSAALRAACDAQSCLRGEEEADSLHRP